MTHASRLQVSSEAGSSPRVQSGRVPFLEIARDKTQNSISDQEVAISTAVKGKLNIPVARADPDYSLASTARICLFLDACFCLIC